MKSFRKLIFFVSFFKLLILSLFLGLAFSTYLDVAVAKEKTRATGETEVEKYLIGTLRVEGLERFVLGRKLSEQLEIGLGESGETAFDADGKITEAAARALQATFSPQSKLVLKHLVRALGKSSYSNSMLVGPAGSGKTFAMNQLVAILSFGVVPEFLNEFLSPEEASNYMDIFREGFLEKTQIISVDHDLLNRDPTPPGQAWPDSDSRKRNLLIGLFEAAKADFRQTKTRTIFVLEEVAQLPSLAQATLKTLLDETGFKTPSRDPVERGRETGVSVIGVTTPGEYREMVGGDSAIERRYQYVYILEPTEEEALQILIKKKEDWLDRYGLFVEDEVLAYVISMRKFFRDPPSAMPSSVLAVMEEIFLWATEPKNRQLKDEVTVDDAYRYLIEHSHLPRNTWIAEEGKVPLWDLRERVQSHVIGHETEIEHIIRRIKTGRATAFQSLPVFIIMGPSGAGKDTLAKAINVELFGHDGAHLNFDVGGPQGQGLGPLLDGNERELPRLITALSEGPSHGVIVLNEAKGLPSNQFDRLKVLVEQGVIHPKGRDSRARPLGINILFIMGQYGEELLEGKTDEEMAAIVESLSESDLIEILMRGEGNGSKGAMPYALIQRALRTGGIFFLKPPPQDSFVNIARKGAESIVKSLKVKSQMDMDIDESVLKYVSNLAIINKRGTRGLDELLSTFTLTAVSEAYDRGLPLRGARVRTSVDLHSEMILLEHLGAEGEILHSYHFQPSELLTSRCSTLLGGTMIGSGGGK